MDVVPNLQSSALSITTLVIVTGFITFVLRNYSHFQTWKKQNIPGPNPWLLYLGIFRIMHPNFKDMELDRIRKYGKVFGIHDTEGASLLVSDPEILKEMLIRDFHAFSDRRNVLGAQGILKKMLFALSGDEWKQVRSVISPTFTTGKIKAMIPLIRDAVDHMVKKLDAQIGKEIDLKALFGSLSMDVIGRCAFAVDTKTKEADQFIHHALGFLNFSFLRVLCIILTPKFLRDRIGMTIMPPKHGQFLESLVLQILSQRRRMVHDGIQSNQYTDFMQLMIEAGTHKEADEEPGVNAAPGRKKTLTDEEIAANAMLILIAGYDTTAATLAYAVLSLACNPDVQERLHEEVSRVTDLNHESISRLEYLDAVISETLRMYPAAMQIDRQVSAKEGYTFECVLGKVHMPYGSGLLVPIYSIHHMEEYYPDPYRFDPERFMPENKHNLVPYSFLPFVIGPRNCVGMRFALLEAKITLVTLIQKYRFTKTSKTDDPIDFRGSFITLKAKRIIVKIEDRI